MAKAASQIMSGQLPVKLGIGFDDDDDPTQKRKKQQQQVQEDASNMNIFTACSAGYLSIVVLNWAQGCDLNQPDDQGYSCIMWAALEGRNEIIRFLVDQGCNVNYRAPDGQTALMWATVNDHISTGKLLIELGGDPKIADRNGYDAAFIAVHHNRLHWLHMMQALKPIDPNLRDHDGHHLTTWACYKGDLPMLEYLHQVLKVPLTEKDNVNRTALHWAAREGWTDCVRYCIANGLSTMDTDNDGQTPIDYARDRHHEFALAALKAAAGAQENHCVGSLALMSQNKTHLWNSVLAVVYFCFHFGWCWLILPCWAHMPTSAFGGKNMAYAFMRQTPVRGSVPETTLMEDIGAPKTLMGALKGPKDLRRREVANIFALASFVAVQYVSCIYCQVPLHPMFMPLCLAVIIFGFLAKSNPFKNVVAPQTIQEDPSLAAVDKGEYQSLHPRIYNTNQHIRVPLRAFYCYEIDRVVKRYDSWSLMLDTPITSANHRSFFFCITSFFLLQACQIMETWSFMTEKYCEDGHQYQITRVVWNMFFSNLPCAMKPLSDSWKDWWMPQPHNVAGVWLLTYAFPVALFAFSVIIRNLTSICRGVSRAELNDRTAPTVNGEMENITRPDGSFVYSDGFVMNVVNWLLGRAGDRWKDATALPTTHRPMEEKKCAKKSCCN